MSQIYKNNSSGPFPPAVPTQFTADDGTVGIPVGNNLDILTTDTKDNNDNGIQSIANPDLGDNITIELTNRTTGTVTTTDAVVTTIKTFALDQYPGSAVPATFIIWGTIVAFKSAAAPASAAFTYSGGYRTDGSIAVELGTEFHDTFQDPALATCDIFLTVNGLDNNVYVQVQGVDPLSINWNCLLEYRTVI